VGKFLCSIAEGTSNYLVRQHQENPEIGLDLMQRNAQAMSARDLIESGSRWSDVGLRNRLQKRTATTDYVPDGKGGVCATYVSQCIRINEDERTEEQLGNTS
jgi:hypothetical protein